MTPYLVEHKKIEEAETMRIIKMRKDGIEFELKPMEFSYFLSLSLLAKHRDSLSEIKDKRFQRVSKDFYAYVKMLSADATKRNEKGGGPVKLELSIEHFAVFQTIYEHTNIGQLEDKGRTGKMLENAHYKFGYMVKEYIKTLEAMHSR
jgi:hypothetical protein